MDFNVSFVHPVLFQNDVKANINLLPLILTKCHHFRKTKIINLPNCNNMTYELSARRSPVQVPEQRSLSVWSLHVSPASVLLLCFFSFYFSLHSGFPHNPKTGGIGELEMIIAHIFDCLYMAAMDP